MDADALPSILLLVRANRQRDPIRLSSVARYRVETGAGVQLRLRRRVVDHSALSSGRWRCSDLRGCHARRVVPVQTLAIADPHPPWLTSPLSPRCIDGASVWRAPGGRWSDCPSCWDVSCSSCSQCSSSRGVATMLLGTGIGDIATTRLVILAVVNAYALSRGLICLVRALAGRFRPVSGSRRDRGLYRDMGAAHVWVGVSGIALCQRGAAVGFASRRLRGGAAPGDAGRASLYRASSSCGAGGRSPRHLRAGRPRVHVAARCATASPSCFGTLLAIALDLAHCGPSAGDEYPATVTALLLQCFSRHHRGER